MTRRPRRGSYATEFALLLPVWIALILGGIDILWLGSQITRLGAATEAACRHGARLDPGPGDADLPSMEAAVQQSLDATLTAWGLGDCASCTLSVTLHGEPPNRTLRCDVTRPSPPLAGYVFPTVDIQRTRDAALQWPYPSQP